MFRVDAETCPKCGGTVTTIAIFCAEDPPVLERGLNQLASKHLPGPRAESRALPARPFGLLQLTAKSDFRRRAQRLRRGVNVSDTGGNQETDRFYFLVWFSATNIIKMKDAGVRGTRIMKFNASGL